MKTNILLRLKALHGSLYVRVLLKNIYLAKLLFIQEIEMGSEAFIPYQLS